MSFDEAARRVSQPNEKASDGCFDAQLKEGELVSGRQYFQRGEARFEEARM